MQVDGRKGHFAGHALEQRNGIALDEEFVDGRVDFAGRDARPHQCRGNLVGLPDQQAGLSHLRDFTR